MKIILEMGEVELNQHIMKSGKITEAWFDKTFSTIEIKGKLNIEPTSFALVEYRTVGEGWFPNHKFVYEEVRMVKVKTKEEKAAEESVAKAKEALKAAEDTLKAVKEKK